MFDGGRQKLKGVNQVGGVIILPPLPMSANIVAVIGFFFAVALLVIFSQYEPAQIVWGTGELDYHQGTRLRPTAPALELSLKVSGRDIETVSKGQLVRAHTLSRRGTGAVEGRVVSIGGHGGGDTSAYQVKVAVADFPGGAKVAQAMAASGERFEATIITRPAQLFHSPLTRWGNR